MIATLSDPPGPAPRGPAHLSPPLGRRGRAGLLAAALVALGAVAGAGAMRLAAPHASVTLLTPGPVSALKAGSVAAVKGSVAERFGSSFVLQDTTGRALVDTGPSGRDDLVQPGEAVTVQGRYEHGALHAQLVIHADGHADTLGPAGRPPHPPAGPAGWLPAPNG